MAIGILSGQRPPDGYYDVNTHQRYDSEQEYRRAQEMQRREYERMLSARLAVTNLYGNASGLASNTAHPAQQPVKPARTGPAEPNPLAFMNNVNAKLLLTGELK